MKNNLVEATKLIVEDFKYVSNNRTYMLSISYLFKNESINIEDLASNSLQICLIWGGKNLVTTMLSFTKSYFEENLQEEMDKKIVKNILLNKNLSKKILSLENRSDITNNLLSSFTTLSSKGKLEFQELTINKLQQLISLNEIIKISPESLILELIKDSITKKITEIINNQAGVYNKELNKVECSYWNIKANLGFNFNQAVLINALQFINNQYDSILFKKGRYSIKLKSLDNAKEYFIGLLDIGNKFIEI